MIRDGQWDRASDEPIYDRLVLESYEPQHSATEGKGWTVVWGLLALRASAMLVVFVLWAVSR